MARNPLKLSQVIAISKGAKAEGERALTTAYHSAQSTPRLSGIVKTYKPKDEDGETLPSEGNRLQLQAATVIKDVENALGRLLDVELTKDAGNQLAIADVVVGDRVIAEKIPVTFLLTLEKKLVDISTFVSKLPVLDPGENWTWSDDKEAFTATSETTRSKKVLRNHVKAEATDKHPAQVEVFGEDTIIGTWTTVKLSGALPQARVNELKRRVAQLQDAVKIAREAANSTIAPDREIGATVFGFLFE